MIRGYPLLIKFSFFLIKLEYYVNLYCLHLFKRATDARIYPKHYLAFGLPIPTSTIALNPPPWKVYDFPELAINNINKFTKGQGYTVATFQSKTDKQILPTMRKIWLGCAKGRTYTDASRTRFAGSHIIECPFKATLTRILIS